jgi:hypothetical protein
LRSRRKRHATAAGHPSYRYTSPLSTSTRERHPSVLTPGRHPSVRDDELQEPQRIRTPLRDTSEPTPISVLDTIDTHLVATRTPNLSSLCSHGHGPRRGPDTPLNGETRDPPALLVSFSPDKGLIWAIYESLSDSVPESLPDEDRRTRRTRYLSLNQQNTRCCWLTGWTRGQNPLLVASRGTRAVVGGHTGLFSQ